MKIVVKYYGLFKETVGKREETINIQTPNIKSLIKALSDKHGYRLKRLLFDKKTNELLCAVVVNDEMISHADLSDVRLNDGDSVTFI